MTNSIPADAHDLPADAFLSMEEIEAEVERCYGLAGIRAHKTTVTMDVRGFRVLGLCNSRRCGILAIITLRFNAKLWPALPAWKRRDTIRHEAAHAIEYINHGTAGHGSRWKAYARLVGARPERCASAESMGDAHGLVMAERAKRLTKGYCNCAEPLTISKVVAGKIRKGHGYRCQKCRAPITLQRQTESKPLGTLPPSLLSQAIAKAQAAGLILEPEAVELIRNAAQNNRGQRVALRLKVRSASMPEIGAWTLETPFTFEVP